MCRDTVGSEIPVSFGPSKEAFGGPNRLRRYGIGFRAQQLGSEFRQSRDSPYGFLFSPNPLRQSFPCSAPWLHSKYRRNTESSVIYIGIHLANKG
ncbi:hypothetical protein FRX31_029494 [Thalictrum thalictroides]|uniref:Uncharacterized protein n=1 Tax=Thalictrum thalictroides TaxID=46969 RepID=A0A7J6V9Q0_THATH|nr:hypothetical protein FRX31_029494 [Thalictrum thalictroides]